MPAGPVNMLAEYARRYFNTPLVCGHVAIYTSVVVCWLVVVSLGEPHWLLSSLRTPGQGPESWNWKILLSSGVSFFAAFLFVLFFAAFFSMKAGMESGPVCLVKMEILERFSDFCFTDCNIWHIWKGPLAFNGDVGGVFFFED